MKILYRSDGTAWVDLREEPAGTQLEPQELDALQAFTCVSPIPPNCIPIGNDGVAEYVLLESGVWPHDEDGINFAEYTVRVEGGESPLPWPPPSEKEKSPGRMTLTRIRRDVDAALRGWESNEYAAVVQSLKNIEREARELIEPASKLIKNYER